jgi:hypothetical protein
MTKCEMCKSEYPPLRVFKYDARFCKDRNKDFHGMNVCNSCYRELESVRYSKEEGKIKRGLRFEVMML